MSLLAQEEMRDPNNNIDPNEPLVVFQNKGLLDLRCITTFGVTVKEHDNPIGQFGTGLKYAIAILLRNDIEPIIHIGTECYNFTARKEEIRNKEFSIIYMNETPMPFTTELGSHWELWMAFRELYSNTQDEYGDVWLTIEKSLDFDETQTTIIVPGEEFAQILEAKADVFIQSTPIIETSKVDIHEGETNSVFNRGIKIAEFDKPLLYKYDINKTISLTEDRTPSYSWEIPDTIFGATVNSNDPSFIEKILTAPKEFVESTLNFGTINLNNISDTFKETLYKLVKKGRNKLNPTVIRAYDTMREKAAARFIPESYTVIIQRPKGITQQEIEEFIKEAIIAAKHNLDCEGSWGELRETEINVEVY